MIMSRQKEICIHYYPKDGVEWAKYIQAKLGEKEYEIDIALNDVTFDQTAEERSRINIFLITPDFLDLKDFNIMVGLDHRFSVAVLMGIDKENFTTITRHHGVQEDIRDWLTLVLDGSKESVRHLLINIVTLYEYDYLPQRLRPIFMEVIDRDMYLYIGLEKKAKSKVNVQFDGNDKQVEATFMNRYFYGFSLTDEMAHMFSTFSVISCDYKIAEGQLGELVPSPYEIRSSDDDLNDAPRAVGRTKSNFQRLWELLKEESDPISLLCQSMGLNCSDSEQLDRILTNNVSVLGDLEDLSLMDIYEESSQIQREETWPTLLHFAAEFNLVRFAEALLSYPAFAGASKIVNCDGHTPDEIAYHAGHQKLSETLKLFSHCMFVVQRWSNDGGFVEMMRHPKLKATDMIVSTQGSLSASGYVQSKQSPRESMPSELIMSHEFYIETEKKHEAKTRGFLSKLFRRKEKPGQELQRQNRDAYRICTLYEAPVERESVIVRSKSVSSSNRTGREKEKTLGMSPRLSHAEEDKNISGPSIPSKQSGHC